MNSDIEIERLADYMRHKAGEPMIPIYGPLTTWSNLSDAQQQIWIQAARQVRRHGLESEVLGTSTPSPTASGKYLGASEPGETQDPGSIRWWTVRDECIAYASAHYQVDHCEQVPITARDALIQVWKAEQNGTLDDLHREYVRIYGELGK